MKTGVITKKILSYVVILLVVFITAFLCFALVGCDKDPDDKESVNGNKLPKITDVKVARSSYVYDGEEHGIELEGVLPSDIVVFSLNGECWLGGLAETEIGEYLVYYMVIREGYENYIATVTLVISRTLLTGVSAFDVTSIYGDPIVPRLEGVESGDNVRYAVDGDRLSESIGALDVGEHAVSFVVIRSGVGTTEGTFKLTVLPDISGTYIGNGERIILTNTTAVLNGDEYDISYDVDGRGYIDAGDDALSFSVVDGVLEINQKSYAALKDGERVLDLRINGLVYYAARKEDANVHISFIRDSAVVWVNENRVVELEEYNYCESVIGCDNLIRNYMWRRVEFSATSDLIDITLSLRTYKAVDPFEFVVLYDGNEHAPDIEYEYVLYNGSSYYTTPESHTEPGSYRYFVIVLRDEYLPQPVPCTLTILPDMSGTYVANGHSVLYIDGFSVRLNDESIELECGVNGYKIDGEAVEYEDGKITFGGVEYKRSDVKLLAIMIGDHIDVVEWTTEESTLKAVESEGKTFLSLIDAITEDEYYSTNIAGSIISVSLNGRSLSNFSGEGYFVQASNIGIVDVSWLMVEIGE